MVRLSPGKDALSVPLKRVLESFRQTHPKETNLHSSALNLRTWLESLSTEDLLLVLAVAGLYQLHDPSEYPIEDHRPHSTFSGYLDAHQEFKTKLGPTYFDTTYLDQLARDHLNTTPLVRFQQDYPLGIYHSISQLQEILLWMLAASLAISISHHPASDASLLAAPLIQIKRLLTICHASPSSRELLLGIFPTWEGTLEDLVSITEMIDSTP